MPFFRGTGEQAVKFGEHKIMCANNINTVIKNLFSYLDLLKLNFNFLAGLCSLAGWFEYHFVGNPEDRFCFDAAQLT